MCPVSLNKGLGYPGLLSLAMVFLLTSFTGAAGQARKSSPLRSTDPGLRLEGYNRMIEMQARSPFKDLKWHFLGPVNVSGRMTDIAVVTPKGRNYTIYAATASGGVWKTVNEGTTWSPVFERAVSTSIGDIALSPANPQTLWIGTGEANIYRSSQAGCGVYKSTDGGQTWLHAGLADTNTIARIIVHPADGNTVFVAASGHEWTPNPERGVFKTTDGGQTWSRILYVNDRTGAIDLVMDPKNNDILYAALWERTRLKWNDPRNAPTSKASGIYKTTDGGATWKQVNDGLPEARYRGRIGVDICLEHPETLYALVDNYEKSREPTPEELADPYGIPSSGFIKGATLFRSDDGGDNWRQVSGLTPEQKTYMERHSGTYGWVFGQVRAHPKDPDTVFTLGLMLNVSRDGGKTVNRVPGPGVDHHALWIDPETPDYMIKGFDQGLAVTYDGGRNWRYFQNEIPACQFFNVAYDMASPFRVYGSMQDHGSFRGAVDLSRGRDRIPAQNFESAPGGEGSTHAIDPSNPDIVYSSGFYGTLSRTDLAKRGREGRKLIVPRTYEDEPALRGQWLAPTILSPHNPDIIYHGMQYLFRSLDRGNTWERISPDLTTDNPAERGDIRFQTIFSISESPIMPGLIYAGSDDGRVWLTRNGGKTWKEITAGAAPGKWVSRIVASAFRLGTVYLTQNGKRDDDFTPYVMKSSDYGRTWIDISKTIPVGPVNVIREDPANPDILYLGTDMGVYVSTDGGRSWQVLGSELPSCYVHDLIVHPRDNVIVIATHGRGMWALNADPVNKKNQLPRSQYDDY